jgi:histone H3/H4
MAEQEILVIASKVKAFVSTAGMRCDGELTAAVSTKLEQLLTDAVARAKINGRQTVRPGDL